MRKLAWFAFSFSLAAAAFVYVLPEQWLIAAAAVCGTVAAVSFFVFGKQRRQAFVAFLGLAVGFIWCFACYQLYYCPAERMDGRECQVHAYVSDYPEELDYGTRISVRVVTGDGPTISTRLYDYGRDGDELGKLIPGDEISFTASFSLANKIYGEKTDQFMARGVFLTGKLNGEVQLLKSGQGSLRGMPQRLCEDVKTMIGELYSGRSAAFLQAIITGDRTLLNADKTDTSALKTSGVYHIVAVSGMHVAFLVTFIVLIFGRRPWALCVSIPIILVFMAMVGFTPSVTRAGIMQIILLTAELTRREADRITTLSAALLLLIAVNPYSAASASLQLSFAAVLGLILISQKVYDWLIKVLRADKQGKLLRFIAVFLASSLSASVGALAFTVPLSAVYFGYVSLAAPLSNLLILPAASFVFCGGLVSIILGYIALPIGKIAAFIIALPAKYILSAARLISGFSFASIYMVNTLMLIWIVWLYAVIISAVILKAKPRQLIIPAAVLFVCLCAIAVGTSASSRSCDMSFTVLDVGQGQSIVVTSNDAAFVTDCGSSSGGDAGNVAADYLLSTGRDRVDILFLTHYDADHVNGLEDLLARVEVDNAMLPPVLEGEEWKTKAVTELLERNGTKVSFVNSDTLVELQSADVRLFPVLDENRSSDSGLCFLYSSGDWDALVTGDIDFTGEKSLLTGRELPDIELLVAGHHGSAHSTSFELLESLRPEIAVISVGQNKYGHPTEETLRRLEIAGVSVYRTDECGSITFNAG